jgi:hypothetical protein
MKISGFTFVRNGQSLGFPFIQSIRSILPICDEFIVNVGQSDDQTLAMIQAINDPKIKIIETVWNPHMRTKGYLYGEHKMIAQFACTGDWAFYLEADEVIHEQDLPTIVAAMQQHLEDPNIEALAFRYRHFYGNINTYAWSPVWYRVAPRIIKRSVRSYAPDGLYWLVLDSDNKKGRYPKAALIKEAIMYHYGWVRPEANMVEKFKQISIHWKPGYIKPEAVGYARIDPQTLHAFKGTHPQVMDGFFSQEKGLFQADPHHVLTRRERKHRLAMRLEKWFGIEFGRTHCKLVK